MRVRNNIEKLIKKYIKAKDEKPANKTIGTYCPKVSGCCFNHLPVKKKNNQEEQA